MEECPNAPLRNISLSSDNQTSRISQEEDEKMEITSTPDIEVIKERLNESKESKAETPQTTENKKVKIKKIKVKKNRGEKRKLTEKNDITKKIKKKKKEEKSSVSENPTVHNSDDDCLEIEVMSKIHSTPLSKSIVKKDGDTVENDSDAENREIQVKQKSKQMSSRKSKAVANACKDTLEILIKLGVDILGSMDMSLKILKSHNFLNSKHIPIDTLMDLVSLALETNRASGVDFEKETHLSRIVSKLTSETCSTPKTSKVRQSIPAVPLSPKQKTVVQEEASTTTQAPQDEVVEMVKNEEQEEKMEESKPTPEVPEKNADQAVEKSRKNFRITNYFKKLKKNVEEKDVRDKNERFSCFSAKTDMFIAPKVGGELTGERREKFEEEFSSQTCEVKDLFQHNPKYSNVDSNTKKNSTTNKSGQKSLVEQETKEQGGDNGNTKAAASQESKEDSGNSQCKNGTSESDVQTVATSDPPVRKKVALVRVDQPKIILAQTVSRTKAKLLQFHENRRPPYWGTWRRKSESVKGRKPFGKDKLLNYEIDSDDEWENEEEPGESLHGSDDEKEPEEDYEVDNDFFVPHGYLSDDENPEKENIKTKLDLLEEQFTSEQKQKTRKMTPLVFGSFWVHKDVPAEGSLYQDLQIESLQVVPWTSTPIIIEDEEDKKNESFTEQTEPSSQQKKQRQKIIFPDEEIPNLIKMIHGSPQNCELLAKKFLNYWEGEKIQEGKRPCLTKICVLKKIKELATWQTNQEKGRCWQVPKETRKEFGADTEVESPTKKPRKCFIWKFVKKAEKSSGADSPSANPEPEVVILES